MKEKIRNSSIVRRLLSIIAAVVMTLGMVGGNVVPAMAATNDGKITIKNTVAGEQYNVYKIFDATTGTTTSFDATGTTADSRTAAYTYTKSGDTDAFLNALQGENSPFTLTQQGSSSTYNVELKNDKNANDVVTFLNGQLSNISSKKVGGTYTASAKNEGSQAGEDIEINNLSYGYYYITTTTGSAVTINSAINEVTVEDKNSVPSIDKKQSVDTTSEKTYTDDTKTASIGDTVYYEITVNAGKTNNTTYTVTDTLSSGLTLNHNDNTINGLSVQKFTKGTGEGTDVPAHADAGEGTGATAGYTVSNVTDQGFTITFDADYVKTLNGANGTDAADTIVIKYSATINSNAVIAGDGNTNTAQLKYSNQTTTDQTTVKTYQFDLVKTKAQVQGSNTFEVLSGAKFQLFKGQSVEGQGNEDRADKVTGATAIHFKKATVEASSSDTNKSFVTTYTVTTDKLSDDVVDTIDAGNVRIIGLGNGTYALEETEAPSGYNKLTYIKKVIVNDANNDAIVSAAQYTSGGVQVINNAGSLLPSTGGIGTTIFYVIGGVVIAGAVIMLIARRKNA